MSFELTSVPLLIYLIFLIASLIYKRISKKIVLIGMLFSALLALFCFGFNQIYILATSIIIGSMLFLSPPKEGSEKTFYVGSTYFWALAFFTAGTPLLQVLCILAYFVNAIFYRQIYRIKKSLIKENLIIFITTSPFFIYVFVNRFYEHAFGSEGFTSLALGMVLVLLVLLVYYYLMTCLIPQSTEEGFFHSGIHLCALFLIILKITIDYDLQSLKIFEEPYRLRFLMWLVFCASVLLPFYRVWRGNHLEKIFALQHVVIFLSLALFLQYSEWAYANITQVLLSLGFVLILSVCSLSDIDLKKETRSLLYILNLLILLSPLNHALNKVFSGILENPEFWQTRAEILFFPPYISFVLLAATFIYAVSLGSDLFSEFKISNIRRPMLVNFPSLLGLCIFVLGIYPFPLYIYIQFIME